MILVVLILALFFSLDMRAGGAIRVDGGAGMSASLQGPWNLYVEHQTTAIQKTSFLCRATGKPCQNATDLGFCKLTLRDIEQMEASALDKQDEYFVGWNDAIKICQTASTIVPAERSET